MKLFFDICHPSLEVFNFEIDKLDFSKFEFPYKEDGTKPIIPIEDCTFRDIFNFADNLFYSEPGHGGHVFELGSVLIFYKNDNNIYINYAGQNQIRSFDENLNPNPYGLDIDKFDIDSGNYFISIKSPGGYFCYQLDKNPYNEQFFNNIKNGEFWKDFLKSKGFSF